jgi:hypothetical protein
MDNPNGVAVIAVILLFQQGRKREAYQLFMADLAIQQMTFEQFCTYIQAIIDGDITLSA